MLVSLQIRGVLLVMWSSSGPGSKLYEGEDSLSLDCKEWTLRHPIFWKRIWDAIAKDRCKYQLSTTDNQNLQWVYRYLIISMAN